MIAPNSNANLYAGTGIGVGVDNPGTPYWHISSARLAAIRAVTQSLPNSAAPQMPGR